MSTLPAAIGKDIGMNEKTISGKRGFGTIAAFMAYGIWGVFPLYWKQLHSVDSIQILAHRFVWAAFFCLAALVFLGKAASIPSILKDRKKMAYVLPAAILITVNWGVYIIAINSGRVTESALGYYINPLISVALGAAFAGEKMDLWTGISTAIAGAGILVAALVYGSIPWISLILAASFAIYGLVKKKAGLDPMASLAVETLMVAPFAVGYLAFRQIGGSAALVNAGTLVSALLVFSGLLTAIPLVLFAIAANSISLQRMGFIQYISPSLQLAIGVLIYGEKPEKPLLITLVSVLVAVSIYVLSHLRPESNVAVRTR